MKQEILAVFAHLWKQRDDRRMGSAHLLVARCLQELREIVRLP